MKYLSCWIIFFCHVLLSAQQDPVDSLKQALKKSVSDSDRCVILSGLAETASDEEWPAYNEQLLMLAQEKLKDARINPVSRVFYKTKLASAYNNFGYLNKLRGNNTKAMEFYHEGLKVFEELKDKTGIARSFLSIGIVYMELDDAEKAVEYHQKAMKLQEEVGDRSGFAESLNNLAYINYHKGGELAYTMNYLRQSVRIYEEIGNKLGEATTLNNIGFMYNERGIRDSALEYFNAALKIREEMGDKDGIANSLTNIGWLYSGLKNYKKAEEYLQRSMQLGEETGFPLTIKDAASSLYLFYKQTGKFQSALKYYELFIRMQDSINSADSKAAAIKSQLKYEYEKKAAADSVRTIEEKKVVQAQLKQEQVQRYSLLVGLLLVVVFALFMVNRFRVTNKQKKVIEEQKRVVEHQKVIVEVKQKEILDSIRYAHRIQKALISSEGYIQKRLQFLNK